MQQENAQPNQQNVNPMRIFFLCIQVNKGLHQS